MLRSISYCGLRIEYKLEKKNVKNINIRIMPDTEITVSAPLTMSTKKIDAFIEKKAEWIFRKMAEVEKRREAMPDDELYTGKPVYYLGKEYTMDINVGTRFGVERTDKEIIVHTKVDDDRLKSRYLSWLTNEARPVFEDSVTRMLDVAKDYNIERPEIYIRNMTTRWGSCNRDKKRVGLNVQLMKADIKCIDQVVLHELAHFVHFDHSEAFYNVLDTLMPDWRERKEDLENNYLDGIR